MTTTPAEYTEAVAAEVRAQLGRHRKTARDLAQALKQSPQAAGRRLNGELPFDVLELASIALWLDIEFQVLIPNAEALTA